MNNILNNIPNLKILYLILLILLMTMLNIILNKKNINENYKYLINGIVLIVIALITNYFKDIIDGIFSFNFLSVKLYIVILIITNIITLITMSKKIKNPYKITNYILFILMTIILSILLILVTGVNLNLISESTSKYSVMLLNISIIIFIIYLIAVNTLYIVKNLNIKEKEHKVSIKEKFKNKPKIKKQRNTSKEDKVLSDDDLLSYKNKNSFYINGEECSIIFEDSIKENIIKNYHILLKDINAKLVNGYTLEENKLLRSICTKLKIKNLNDIDINNLSILNKINVEEYNFLKKINK